MTIRYLHYLLLLKCQFFIWVLSKRIPNALKHVFLPTQRDATVPALKKLPMV
jgi:hypothetical protein